MDGISFNSFFAYFDIRPSQAVQDRLSQAAMQPHVPLNNNNLMDSCDSSQAWQEYTLLSRHKRTHISN